MLAVRLADRDYALPLDAVLEIVQMVDIIPVPEAPAWMAGFLDYRGRLVPVVDARVRLDLPPRERSLSTPIVLAGAASGVLGVIVDEAEGLLRVPAPAISPTGPAAIAPGVSGTVHHAERILLILDVDRLGDGVLEMAASSPDSSREAERGTPV